MPRSREDETCCGSPREPPGGIVKLTHLIGMWRPIGQDDVQPLSVASAPGG